MGEVKHAYKVLFRKCDGKSPLARYSSRWIIILKQIIMKSK
jgi:hypothetical protein